MNIKIIKTELLFVIKKTKKFFSLLNYTMPYNKAVMHKRIFLIFVSTLSIISLEASFFSFIPQGRMPAEKCFNNLIPDEKTYLKKKHPNYLDKLAQSFETSEEEIVHSLENASWLKKWAINVYHVDWLLKQHQSSVTTFSDLELLLLLTHTKSQTQPPATLGKLISSSEKLRADYPEIIAVWSQLENKRNNFLQKQQVTTQEPFNKKSVDIVSNTAIIKDETPCALENISLPIVNNNVTVKKNRGTSSYFFRSYNLFN